MKTVYLIRHAKSSWKDPSLDDIDRPLNKRGLRDAPFMAKLLKGRGVQPDRLVSSPAKRARLTANYFAEALDISPAAIEIRREIYEAFPEDVLEVIQTLPASLGTVLIFGHNPTFTSLAKKFTEEYIANVPTCGIVHLEADIDAWSRFDETTARMLAFYYPKQYFN